MTAALVGFALATTLLILAPGPDSLLVMRNTVRGGRRAGLATAAGTLSGLLVWAIGATLGLSALLQASRLGYDVLRVAGAAYLIWLGVTTLGLFHRRTPHSHHPAAPTAPVARLGRVYLNGLVSNVFNPKIWVFFIAFLPGFIPAGEPTAMFSLTLGLWFVVETGLWLATVVWMVTRGVGWLRRTTVQRWIERATGAVLIGFGLRLATEAR